MVSGQLHGPTALSRMMTLMPTTQETRGTPSRYGSMEKTKIFCSCLESNPEPSHSPARSLVSIPTDLSRLSHCAQQPLKAASLPFQIHVMTLLTRAYAPRNKNRHQRFTGHMTDLKNGHWKYAHPVIVICLISNSSIRCETEVRVI